jgi:hypothetical protein
VHAQHAVLQREGMGALVTSTEHVYPKPASPFLA